MTGFQLKLLAMLAMTADHIGAVFFPEIPLLRWIGRLAMPVLCFFIGEGLRHTRSPRRYLLRLTGFDVYKRQSQSSDGLYRSRPPGYCRRRLPAGR